MLDKPPSRKNKEPRALREQEVDLIKALAGEVPPSWDLPNATVIDMADGGMGSIRFVNRAGSGSTLGKMFAECEYSDADGVPVMISIDLDKEGNPFEIDFWKVDFSPLRKYPSQGDFAALRITRPDFP